ncbi:uncharacterized protein [Epargyreus clarus]|uniref:uncharacterized protein n=1 Tax=Epargyreus clarus TaxID=520877 RepID=UPI003C30055F
MLIINNRFTLNRCLIPINHYYFNITVHYYPIIIYRMQPWNCCRTCLNVQNLHQIFPLPEHSGKYTEVIFNTTGIKVEPNDTLPQEMCSPCISFINESYKFRRKCELAQQALLDNKYVDIKLENPSFKIENTQVCIDISDLIPEDDFKDFDDNITLDTLQYNYDTQKDTQTQEMTNFDEKPLEITEIVFNGKAKNLKKPVRRRTLRKKEAEDKKDKAERIKEEIQCEYCKKVLTSKLSLRNHYKIHTGFDVVCEHCGKKFITRRLLLMHCRAKHGYEKTDKCSYCDYKASNAEQVKIHERLHTGEKPYVCKECGAGFHRKSSYLQHIAIHLPEKTVPCEQCPARFKSVTLMRIHAARHRAPRYAFRCGLCAGSFARRRNVARHLQRVHADTDTRHIQRLALG